MTNKPPAEGNIAPHEMPDRDGVGDSPKPRGKLKVFLSYAPGTGKTLAMLEDGYRRLQEGADVVIGFIEAYGDMLAMQLLEKFEILPQRVVTGSGISYHGMDLDAVLARRPQLVLVDHLARTNPPGMRHEARYLEVNELLNAGINVYATLNAYQLESQVDAVSYVTGVMVRDTIPDRFMDEADQIEMVDLPPQELLDRYTSGELVFPARAQLQIEKFFLPSNLFALRELTLRYVAQRSNTLMRSYIQNAEFTGPDPGSTRLLVCISESPNASRLVRAGRRMADETSAEWTVVHVETPEQIEHAGTKQSMVAQHLRLAEMLGARTEVLMGRTVVEAVRDYLHEQHIHRVMIGSSPRKQWLSVFGASLAEQLTRDDPNINVFVVGSDHTPHPFQIPRFWNWVSRIQLLGSLVLVLLPTLLGRILTPTVISRSANLIMLYLLSVVIASIFLGFLPALLTALLSVLAFDFFFVPPFFSLIGFVPEYAITFISLMVVSVIISTLVSRERSLTRAAQRRAGQVTQLYELSRDLAAAVDMEDILKVIVQHVRRTFDREIVILLPKNDQLVLSASSAGSVLDKSELTAAEWAFQQGRPAGFNTGTFSYASFRYFPLETSRGNIGVMGVCLSGSQPELHPEQMRQLGAYVTKAASAIERALFAEQASQTEILRATERLQTALLNSISHDLRTPLASITGVLSSLRMEDGFLDAETRRELVETAFGEAERLNRLVGNLLDMTRLESGALKISLQPCDVQDVVGSALNALATRLEGHPLSIEIPPELPLVPIDYVLINQVLINLLDNAAKYSTDAGSIDIQAEQVDNAVQIAIGDRGPGIPEEDLQHIFEKFFRVKRFENVVGTGLGLSICKGIVETHDGKIWAENRPGGGVKMIFTLPLKPSRLVMQSPDIEPIQEEVQRER